MVIHMSGQVNVKELPIIFLLHIQNYLERGFHTRLNIHIRDIASEPRLNPLCHRSVSRCVAATGKYIAKSTYTR